MISLLEQLEEAREEIRQLKEVIQPRKTPSMFAGLRLQRAHRAMLDALIDNPFCTHVYLWKCSRGRGDHLSVPPAICMLRKALRGIATIHNQHGDGFYMDPGDRETVRGMRL